MDADVFGWQSVKIAANLSTANDITTDEYSEDKTVRKPDRQFKQLAVFRRQSTSLYSLQCPVPFRCLHDFWFISEGLPRIQRSRRPRARDKMESHRAAGRMLQQYIISRIWTPYFGNGHDFQDQGPRWAIAMECHDMKHGCLASTPKVLSSPVTLGSAKGFLYDFEEGY